MNFPCKSFNQDFCAPEAALGRVELALTVA